MMTLYPLTIDLLAAMPTECTIFYSWQSDLAPATNRSFILKALENAVKALRLDAEAIKVEPVVDRDTAGVSGSPDIAATIFSKIDQAEVFVCDVSIVNASAGGRPTPNPNVLIELGYAAKALGWNRIIMVMNTETGKPESLPFDLRARRITPYALPEALDNNDEKTNRRKVLEAGLKIALRSILTNVSQAVLEPALTLQFANHASRQAWGAAITVASTVYEAPQEWLPDLKNWRSSGVPGLNIATPFDELNAGYWREKEAYLRSTKLIKPIGMLIQNQSSVLMEQVYVEVQGTFTDGISIVDRLPQEPAQKQIDSFSRNIPKFRFAQQKAQTEVLEHGDQWTLSLHFGDVRPKASVWLDEPFYIGSTGVEQLEMRAIIYANNLSEPQTVMLSISFKMERRPALTLEKLKTMPPKDR